MISRRLILIVVTFGLTVAANVYEAHQAAGARAQYRELQGHLGPMTARLEELARERDIAARRLAEFQDPAALSADNAAELTRLRDEIARLREASQTSKPEADPTAAAAQAWLNRERLLKARLEAMPEARIPELALLTEQDWLNAAQGSLETEEDYRRALANLRSRAENMFLLKLFPALQSYEAANNGRFPADISALRPYFKTPPDEAMLQRWAVVPSNDLKPLTMGGDWIITQTSTPDPEFDTRWGAGPNGYGNAGVGRPQTQAEPFDLMASLMQQYVSETGRLAADPSLLLPYATNTVQKAEVQTEIHRFRMLPADQKAELSSLGEIMQSYVAATGRVPFDPSQLLPFAANDAQRALVEKNIRQFQMLSAEEKAGMSNAVQKAFSARAAQSR